MSEQLRIGLLGASRIAELAVTEASRETGDVRAAVAARDPERARAYAAEHGYEGIREGYEELIADDSLDLIYIGLPNGLHATWTIEALRAGRNVLVEKPFASNLAEFNIVAAELERSPGWAWEAFHYADHPLMSRLIEVVRSGEIGEVRELRVNMLMPPPPASDPRWNFDLAGGTMMDLGCYAINGLLLLGASLGLPLELRSAESTPYGPDPRLDATVHAEFVLGDAPATMRTSMESLEWDFSFEVRGTSGSVRAPNFVKPQEDDRLLVRVGDVERIERLGIVSSYTYQLQRIRQAIRSGEHSVDALGRSRRTAELIDAVYAMSGLPLRPGRLS
ncbi:Gfo/Idh/MocA family protein [Leucobacter tenebrionis]|uniref:Gfo/Idh/MocA family protein n=1 Tax=Leucobacter tenebrionis TaxID=2873270 RepID=UPI001CA645B2|nr:Gfo/Idh/MocA family oxidoreductase [Leucobacter tenebrionis]QZY50767.1 Gfo/Idh/MocA family oxidoreductase [Leucobacter tenebrionis]